MTTASRSQNYINHVDIVLDGSSSMDRHAATVVKVVDAEIAHLARRSQELNQETRISIFRFADTVECLIWDKDVLRLPSIAGMYHAWGNTALIAAMTQALRDMRATSQLYGDHAFLHYVITDGEENVSKYHALFNNGTQKRHGERVRFSTAELSVQLHRTMASLADNETVACLVPDQRGVFEAKSYGFPAENIAVWDANSARGVEDVFTTTIRAATETFMTQRTQGVRSTKTLFAAGVDQPNRATLKQARDAGGLAALSADRYTIYAIKGADIDTDIRPFVERETHKPYVKGSAFYLLMKPEKIQRSKQICIRDKKSGRVYTGAHARDLLGLSPDVAETRVKPDRNPLYEVFVQSTSVNRKLVAGMKLLVLHD